VNKKHKPEIASFLIIVAIAVFFRFFDAQVIAHQTVIGIITIGTLYALVRYIFDWQIAAVSSFLLAISPWHVFFSNSELNVIVLPFIATFSFYFLWRGLRHNHIANYLLAGGIASLGAFAGPVYIITPLVAGLTFINYWSYVKNDFTLTRYRDLIGKSYRGFLIYILTLVSISPVISFWSFKSSVPIPEDLSINLISWPILVFFIIGLINELIHWLKRKHGHFSTVHTFILSWIGLSLLPISTGAETYRSLLAIPIISIFSAKGLLWLIDKISGWYSIRDPHYYTDELRLKHEVKIIKIITIVLFLTSLGLFEFHNLFR
jgi:hypothetical protein